jgi:hypothetical protein
MLETYFIKPETVERVRSSQFGPEIERYVTWLAGHGYSSRCVWRRVPLLTAFTEFACRRGARSAAELPAQVDAFVTWRVSQSRKLRHTSRPELAKEIRGPVEHMLGVIVAGYQRRHAGWLTCPGRSPGPRSAGCWPASTGAPLAAGVTTRCCCLW